MGEVVGGRRRYIINSVLVTDTSFNITFSDLLLVWYRIASSGAYIFSHHFGEPAVTIPMTLSYVWQCVQHDSSNTSSVTLSGGSYILCPCRMPRGGSSHDLRLVLELIGNDTKT